MHNRTRVHEVMNCQFAYQQSTVRYTEELENTKQGVPSPKSSALTEA